MKDLFIDFFSSLKLTVLCLALLMVLIFWGTLYQVEHGIWQAQQVFFRSWFIRFGFLPIFPGGKLVMSVLFVNMLVSLLFRMEVSFRKAGLVLTHLGLMLLLAGGWVTYRFGQESFLSLVEGEGSNVSQSYRDWELSLWTDPSPPFRVIAYDTDGLRPGRSWRVPELALELEVETYYPNSVPLGPVQAADNAQPPLNASGIHALQPARTRPQPEEHMPGLIVRARRGRDEHRVLLFGGEAAPTRIEDNVGTVFMALRRKRYPLPITVTLHQFNREYYPGSDIPRSFSSLIEVDNRGLQRMALIAMNQPFRFRDFTFYQASFANLQDGSEMSTFAVTRNVGRILPYVATAMTVIGLILHFLVELVRRRPVPHAQPETAGASS